MTSGKCGGLKTTKNHTDVIHEHPIGKIDWTLKKGTERMMEKNTQLYFKLISKTKRQKRPFPLEKP